MAPIIHELRNHRFEYKICVTAQHREMLDQVLAFFEIVPDYDLDLMKEDQSLNQISSLLLSGVDQILELESPDIVLVQGDTTTAAMVSLAAFHRKIKVGHVEAGLRTYNKNSPFPEEVNRQLISKITDLHFAPTAKANSNLLKEQIPKEHIFNTGNTVVDALGWAMAKMESEPLSEKILKIKALLHPNKKLILVTGHRRENFGKGLSNICEALLELSRKENVELIYPVHLNPSVQSTVHKILGDQNSIHLIPPVSYPTMLWLMQQCDLIISDSGGIQEEAPTLKKMVIVTREFTERMEGVEAGFSIIVGTATEKIVEETNQILDNPPDLSSLNNPYGDGLASFRIVEVLKNNF